MTYPTNEVKILERNKTEQHSEAFNISNEWWRRNESLSVHSCTCSFRPSCKVQKHVWQVDYHSYHIFRGTFHRLIIIISNVSYGNNDHKHRLAAKQSLSLNVWKKETIDVDVTIAQNNRHCFWFLHKWGHHVTKKSQRCIIPLIKLKGKQIHCRKRN